MKPKGKSRTKSVTFQDSPEQREKDIRVLQRHRIEEFQIENTSRCNFKCFMCDRRSPGKDMDESLVGLLTARFPAVDYITLNGFGEPLLSPNVLDFVNKGKQHGHHVFLPTNAFYLTDTLAQSLIDAEVDQINVSIDAATPTTFRLIHGVDAFEKVVSNTRRFVTLRNNTGSKKPKLSFCVVMSRRNLQQFPALVRLAGDIGVERVLFINLTPSQDEHLEQVLYAFPGWRLSDELCQARHASLQEARRIGNELGIKLDIKGFEFDEEQFSNCSMNLGRKLYISADGDVSVCPILESGTLRLGQGTLTRAQRHVFGSLRDSTFEEILNSDSFQSYQSCVESGYVPDFCLGCNWIHGL